MQISLNINDRFNLMNVIGECLSEKKTLPRLLSLLDKLNLTQHELENKDLNLSYNLDTNSFSFNSEFDFEKTFDIDEDIVKLLGV